MRTTSHSTSSIVPPSARASERTPGALGAALESGLTETPQARELDQIVADATADVAAELDTVVQKRFLELPAPGRGD